MKVVGDIARRIADKQFEIIGVNMKFADIPEDELIEVGGKKKLWYNHFKFTEEQEEQWRKEMVKINQGKLLKKDLDFIELRYGFVLDYKQKRGAV